MARSLTAQDLIALPQLSAAETVTLCTQLETAARGHKLAEGAHDALAEVTAARKALASALHDKAPAPTNPEAVAADRDVDHAWSALSEWLSGWARLGDDEHSPIAAALATAIFPDGLGFINALYLAEWSESATRLAKLDERHTKIESLGGKAFIARIRKVHAAYGKVLGVTESKKPAPPAPDVRAAMNDAQEALREYVAKVAASASRKKPKTVELVQALLEPLVGWQVAKRNRAVTPPEGGTAGVTPPEAPPKGT